MIASRIALTDWATEAGMANTPVLIVIQES
jgi:hypothetical protein